MISFGNGEYISRISMASFDGGDVMAVLWQRQGESFRVDYRFRYHKDDKALAND